MATLGSSAAQVPMPGPYPHPPSRCGFTSSRLPHDLTLLVGLLSPTVGSRPQEGRGKGHLPEGKSHQRLPLLLTAREARKCSLFLAGDKTSKNKVSSQVGGIGAHHPLYQEVW